MIIAGYLIKSKSSKTQKRAKKNMKELKANSKKYNRKISYADLWFKTVSKICQKIKTQITNF